MIKPILYHSIEEKNQLERQMFKALTPEQALIRALDDGFDASIGKSLRQKAKKGR